MGAVREMVVSSPTAILRLSVGYMKIPAGVENTDGAVLESGNIGVVERPL